MLQKRALIGLMIASILLGSCATATTLRESREDYLKVHPYLDQKTKEAILSGEPVIGMTKEQVRVTCGSANNVTQGLEGGKYREYWGYPRHSVTFDERGKVMMVK
jgi:hypothetical protein